MSLESNWEETLELIHQNNLLLGGDLRISLQNILNEHPNSREKFTLRILEHLDLRQFGTFVEKDFFQLSEESKATLREYFKQLEELEIDRDFWASTLSRIVLELLDEYKNYGLSIFEGGEILRFLFLVEAHLSNDSEGSAKLVKDVLARILRHLIIFKIYGPLNVLTYKLSQFTLTSEFASTGYSAARTICRFSRGLISIAHRASTAYDYYLSLIRCYPFLTAAIDICSLLADNTKLILSESQIRFCEQERKPLREIRDHTSGWIPWILDESGEEMTLFIDSFRTEILALSKKRGIDAAKREAIFRCKAQYQVPMFALEEINKELDQMQ